MRTDLTKQVYILHSIHVSYFAINQRHILDDRQNLHARLPQREKYAEHTAYPYPDAIPGADKCEHETDLWQREAYIIQATQKV